MQNRTQIKQQVAKMLAEALAFVAAGLFLATFQVLEGSDLPIRVVGYVFLVVALFLVISTFFAKKLLKYANRVDNYLSGGLFVVSLLALAPFAIDLYNRGVIWLFVCVIVWAILLYIALWLNFLRQ